jgi:hypothetical protein
VNWRDRQLLRRRQLSGRSSNESASPQHRQQSKAATASFAVVALVGLGALIAGAVGFKFVAEWTQVPLILLGAATTALAAWAQGRNLSKQSTALILVAVLVVFAAILVAGTVTRPQPVAPTEHITTRIYGDDGELLPIYRITERTQASHCIRSLRSADVQALRCFGSRGPLDPCWANLLGDKGACLLTPWSREVITLTTITEPAPSSAGALHPDTVWALELVNGDRCTFSDGTADVIAGERVNYNCAQGSVLGHPDRSGRVWRVRYNRSQSPSIVSISVRRAWL